MVARSGAGDGLKDLAPDSTSAIDTSPTGIAIDNPIGPQGAKPKQAQKAGAAFNKKVGGTAFKPDPIFWRISEVTTPNDKGPEVVKTLKEKYVPNADKPTTASAEPGKDLASIIAQVDPSGSAQAFPNLVKQFAQIASIMAIAGGGGGKTSSPSSSQQSTLSDAFSEALCILCNRTSFKQVMMILDTLLFNNGIDRIDPGYQTIVKTGIANLIQKALVYGETKIPVIPDPPVIYGNKLPPVELILSDIHFVKALAVKQYYSTSSDPCPGYMVYYNNDQTYNFVKRTSTDYPYASVDAECIAHAQKGIADDVYPYIMKTVIDPDTLLPIPLSPEIMSTILINHKVIHENNGLNLTIGKGSSDNLMSTLSAILGIIGAIVNMTQSSYNSKTILDSGTIGQALNTFSKDIAMAKKMAGLAQGALNGGSSGISSLSGLAGISSLVGVLGQAGVSIPTSALNGSTSIASIISSVASISNSISKLQNSGSSPSQIYSSVSSQTVPSIATIVAAMTNLGFSKESITATVAVLKDIGLT